MLSAFGQQNSAREHKRIMEHMQENDRRRALGIWPLPEVGAVFGFTLDQLVHMLEALAEHVDPKLRNKHPKEIYSAIRVAVQKEDEPKPQTKEELAEHLYKMARKKPTGNGAPKWDKVPDKMKEFWRKQANELIVKGWEENNKC